MGNFFAELKRRHIYQVAAAYAVVAWVLLQLFNNLEPILKLPDWAGTLVLVFLVGGFPIALIFAWTLELKGASLSIDVASRQVKSAEALKGQAGGASLQPASGAKAPVISIAVLPFANMSGDSTQEFFSDGITEEITAALAKVAELRVVARTSAFEFKGRNHNIRAMGEALGASHLLEGSVRKAGDRVRITTQLIKAQDGTHLWSEIYNRELTDIFVVQESIAYAIAGALAVPLGLKQGETLVAARTGDVESYQEYLRARALVRARGSSITQAIATLEPLVQRNPGFAPASALLAQAYFLLPSYDPVARGSSVDVARPHVQSHYGKGDAAARRAMQLDPKNAAGYGALGAIQTQRGKWAEGESLLRQALGLDPTEPDALYNLSILLTTTARFKEALEISEKLRTLEPFVPNYNITVAGNMLMSGNAETAIAILEATPSEAAGGYYRAITLAQAYAVRGRFENAAGALLAMPHPNVVSRSSVEAAAHLIRNAAEDTAPPDPLPVLEGGLAFVYGYVGAPERVMDFAERVREITGGGTIPFIWSPAYASARRTQRFKAHIRAVGLLAYWRARGWPEICRPVGAHDFACD